jgi:hypothetical protein
VSIEPYGKEVWAAKQRQRHLPHLQYGTEAWAATSAQATIGHKRKRDAPTEPINSFLNAADAGSSALAAAAVRLSIILLW